MCRGAIYFRAKDLPAGHFQPIKRIAVRGPVLAICARFKNHEAMKLLIEAGATVNSKAVHSPLGIRERLWIGRLVVECQL